MTFMEPASTPRRRIFRFGPFELDAANEELRKHGLRLRLQDQPLRILVALLEKPGEIVPREDLVRAVWPEGVFVDYERGLNAAVTRLRQVLGDCAGQPRYVETVARKGYRFVAPVDLAENVPVATGNPPAVHAGRRFGIGAAWVWLAGGTALVLLGAIAAANWLAHKDTRGTLVQLTRGAGVSMDPAVSLDGRLLAYVSDRGGTNLHLWVQQLEGDRSPVQLTHDDADVREPAFSPDGSTIAFRSAKDGGGIYTIPPIGGEATRIASEGYSPRFSPDGKWIAYWTGTENAMDNAIGRTYVIPAKGGSSRQVGDDLPSAAYPVWSPDSGRLLVFASDVLKFIGMMDWWVISLDGSRSQRTEAFANLTRQGFDIEGRSKPRPYLWSSGTVIFTASVGDTVNIWQMPLPERGWPAKGSTRRLTAGTTVEVAPSLTPRGQLVFASLNRTSVIGSLRLEADGTATGPLELLTDGGWEIVPSISADGRYLAFNARDAGRVIVVRTKDLHTGKERTLAERAIHPQISRDGSMVAYMTPLPDGRKEIISMNGDGRRVVAKSGGYVYSWSADKSRLLGIKLPYDGCIYSFDARTGKETRFLSRPGFEIYQSKFSPDDSAVLVESLQNSPKAMSKLFVVPIHAGVPATDSEWIQITDGSSWDDKPRWSSDGSLIYLVCDRDGHRCLWAQRIDTGTRRPAGPAFPVHHFHAMRPSLLEVGLWILEMDVAEDKIVVGLGDITGNIWSKELK